MVQSGLPEKIIGIDFSGAKLAGKHLWITRAVREGGRLVVSSCVRGQDLPDSGPQREICLRALQSFIATQGDGIFGLDFPFSLPREMIPGTDWKKYLAGFATRFPTAGTFLRTCREHSAKPELKRPVDIESRAPFSPYNLRIYRQTYYGIRDVLGPLVKEDQVRVLPFQSSYPGKPWILETCPASLLKRLDLYAPYKGKNPREANQREKILEWLTYAGKVDFVDQQLTEEILEDPRGDALDSLLAAYIIFTLLLDPRKLFPDITPQRLIEGYIYY